MISQLESEKANLEQTAANKEAALKAAEADVAAKTEALKKAESDLEKAEGDKSALEAELAVKQAALKKAEEELNKAISEKEETEAQLAEMKTAKESAEARAEAAEKELEEIKNNQGEITQIDISAAKLSRIASKTYTGKALTQSPVVTLNGKTLENGKDYGISYSRNVNVGTARLAVTGKNGYKGTVTATFKIYPKGTSIKSLKALKKGFKVTWRSQKTQTTGYQIRYSTKSSMASSKTVTITKNTT